MGQSPKSIGKQRGKLYLESVSVLITLELVKTINQATERWIHLLYRKLFFLFHFCRVGKISIRLEGNFDEVLKSKEKFIK